MLKDQECIVLGGVMKRPVSNGVYLQKLAAKEYKFSDEYIALNSYLLKKSFELSEGIEINAYECCKECGITLEQFNFIKELGSQDIKPSYEYLVQNKKLSDLENIYFKFNSREGTRSIEDYERLKYEIENVESLREFKTHKVIDDNIADLIDNIASGQAKLFKAPFRAWNEAVKGIAPEDLIVIGAYSGVGKTHMAIQTSLCALNDGARVMYISAENSEEEIKTRFGAHIAKVYETSLYDVDSESCFLLTKAIRAIGEKYDNKLTLARLTNFEDIMTVLRSRAAADMDDMYVLDYIQLFRGKKKYNSERDQLADYSTQLVEFVGKFKKPVLVLSQLVKGETESFKGAQDLLNMATVAGFMFKSPESELDASNKKFYRVKVDFKKVRRGANFTVYGKVWPSDPTIHEVDLNITLEDKELWKLEPRRSYR